MTSCQTKRWPDIMQGKMSLNLCGDEHRIGIGTIPTYDREASEECYCSTPPICRSERMRSRISLNSVPPA